MGRKYKNDFTNLPGTTGQAMAEGCNCITFYNPGGNTGVLNVNDTPINSGCIFMLAGLECEEDYTNYQYNITGASTNDRFYMIRKFYVK